MIEGMVRLAEKVASDLSRRDFLGWVGRGSAALVTVLTGALGTARAQAQACCNEFNQAGTGEVDDCRVVDAITAANRAHANAATLAAGRCPAACPPRLVRRDTQPACRILRLQDGSCKTVCAVIDRFLCKPTCGSGGAFVQFGVGNSDPGNCTVADLIVAANRAHADAATTAQTACGAGCRAVLVRQNVERERCQRVQLHDGQCQWHCMVFDRYRCHPLC